MRFAFVKQALDVFGPWASYAWKREDPTGIFKVWPGKATLWEMTAALEADWFVIPQNLETDYIRASARQHASLADSLEKNVSSIVSVKDIPWETYDAVISFDPVLLSENLPSGPLYTYYMTEHWDRYYETSLRDPLGFYDLFLDHMLAAPARIQRIPQAVAFPYLRDPDLVRRVFTAEKEESLWLDWRVISMLAQTEYWDERCPGAAEAFGARIGMPTRWKAFGATPFGIDNPPRWGDGFGYLQELDRCRYYAAIGRVNGAGQGVCDAASLNCICFGEPEKAYPRLVCHPACLCRNLDELTEAIRRVSASPDLQAEILACQTEYLKKHFLNEPLALLEEARDYKRRKTIDAQARNRPQAAQKTLEEIQGAAQGVEQRFPQRAVLFIGSEAYDAPVITLLQGLQALGFTIYTLYKTNVNAWFCSTVVTDLAGLRFDFVLSNLHWGTRWGYYQTYALQDCLKVLVDGDAGALDADLDWKAKFQRYRQRYVNDPAEAVKLLDCQPYRWVEALEGYEPDLVFTSQKSPADRISHYLPFGIQDGFATFFENKADSQRDLAFVHIPGEGRSRTQMQTWLDEMAEGQIPGGSLWNGEARGENKLPSQILPLVQKDGPKNIHAYSQWGLDKTYYQVLNRANVLIYPGVNQGAWWESKRPWEAYASGCLVLMQKPGIDARDYPPDQICPETVYATQDEFLAKVEDLAARPQEREALRRQALEKARAYFSPVPLARYFLETVRQAAEKSGKGLGQGLLPARTRLQADTLPQVTIFAMPKPFKGNNALIQRNAVRSWTVLQPRPEIILFGDEEGIRETCLEMNLRHVAKVARNEHGTPLVNALMERGELFGSADILIYVNADILLLSDFLPAVKKAAEAFSQFLMIGQRFDLDVNESLDVSAADWEKNLRAYAASLGSLHAQSGMDYFVFRRGVWKDIPPFAIGRTAWDNWLVYQPLLRGLPVIDATPAVFAIHQNHDWSHMAGGMAAAWTGEEALRNRNLAASTPVCSIADATWKINQSGVVRNDPIMPWFKEGMEYLKKGLPDFALTRFLDIIQQEPGLPNVYYGCAVALFQQGRLQELAAACRAELGLQPGAAAVLALLAKIEQAQHQGGVPA